MRDSILGRPRRTGISPPRRDGAGKRYFVAPNTGIQHGTVTVMLDKEGFEVTTYRVDGRRQPTSQRSDIYSNLEEDLKRRDFTINAMAYNETEGLIDIFRRIKRHRGEAVRCVGNPENVLEKMQRGSCGQFVFQPRWATRSTNTEAAIGSWHRPCRRSVPGADSGGTGYCWCPLIPTPSET